jgi:hypothetical protein
MGAARFGQLLGRFVPLSDQDVAEVLEAQAVSGRRFGEIALTWGLCRPPHVWQAWSAQLNQRSERIDLKQLGIDTQALHLVPANIARAFGVLPVRAFDNVVVLATSPSHRPRAESEIPGLLRYDLQFVLCEPEQLARAIETHYAEYSLPDPSGDADAALSVGDSAQGIADCASTVCVM